MSKKLFTILVQIVLMIFSSNLYAQDVQGISTAEDEFKQLFDQWKEAYNKKDLPVVCSIFSKDTTFDYQGDIQRNYEAVCAGINKLFQDGKRRQFSYKIRQVYRSGNLAAVRATWYFQIFSKDKLTHNYQDEGIYVMIKDDKGKWRIVNALFYAAN